MSWARRFLLNLTFLAAGDLTAKALAFLALAHIARVVGTELFGDMAFAVAFTLYFGLIVKQGLDVYGIQEVARDRSRIPALGANILGLRLVSSLAAAAVLIFTLPILGKPHQVKALLLLYGLSFFTTALSCQWVFLATERMKVVAISGILAQLIFSLLAIFLLVRPAQLLWIPLMQFAGELASAIYLFILFRREFGPVRTVFDFRSWSGILRDSLPMGISGALSLIMFNFDVILLGMLKPASEVGQYSAAYKIIAFFSSFVLLYSRNLLPAISRCRGNPSQLRTISGRSQKYVVLLTIPIAAGGALLALPIMRAVFGGAFAGGAAALRILIWIIPISSSRVLLRATLLSHGFQKENLRISVAAALINIGLNGLLIPVIGYVGSAIASLVSELSLLILLHRCVTSRVASLPMAVYIWKPALASLIMGSFVAWYDAGSLVSRVLAGFFVYIAAAFALRAFDSGDFIG